MSETIEVVPARGVRRILRNKSSRNLLIFVGVVIVIALAASFMSGGSKTKESSSVIGAPELPSVQGSAPVSPAYKNALLKDDSQRAANAEKTGGSSTPTLILPSTTDKLPSRLTFGEEFPPVRPVPRATVNPPVTIPQPQPPTTVYQAPQTQQAAPAGPVVDQNLEQAMLKEMASLQPTNPKAALVENFYQPKGPSAGSGSSSMDATSAASQGVVGQSSASTDAMTSSGATTPQSRFIVPAAGTILYSRLIGRVNSDTPGPVIAEILQGPFSGARLLGTFEFSEQGVVISFSSMTVPYKDDNGTEQSEVVPIHAVAVDASHLGTAMATDINQHLLSRIAVAFGTAFLSGIGQAVQESGSTVSTGLTGMTVANSTLNTRDQLLVGAGAASAAAGNIFNDIYGNRRTTITVADGTPFGLLFLGNSN